MDIDTVYVKSAIREKASALGFDACAIARSRPLEEHRERFLAWLNAGYGEGLDYLGRNLDQRFDPARLVPGARSVVVCAVSYNRGRTTASRRSSVWQPETLLVGPAGMVPELPDSSDSPPRIASYALAKDYHITLKEKLRDLLAYIGELTGGKGRVFVDSGLMLEKAWAVEAGLGWIGRNSLLIHPRLGSFLLLGMIVTDALLEPDTPYVANGCGTCARCVEKCPTGAINTGCTIDTRRCISRLTIEKIPSRDTPHRDNLHGWVYGCDVCQEVCPHNLLAPVMNHDFLSPLPGSGTLSRADWLAMTESEFAEKYGETPLTRAGLPRIQKLLKDEDPIPG